MSNLFDVSGGDSPPALFPAKKTPEKKPMPKWLERHLNNEGLIDSSQDGPPATRKTISIWCPKCHRPIMRGLRPMPTPWAVDADPTPLSPEGEVLALLAGIRTYELTWRYDHYEIEWRDEVLLRNKPAGGNQGFDILVEHACGARTNWPKAQKRHTPDPHVGRSETDHPVTANGSPPF